MTATNAAIRNFFIASFSFSIVQCCLGKAMRRLCRCLLQQLFTKIVARHSKPFGFRGIIASMRRVLLSWSSGKDSAWTLHLLRRQPDIEIIGLLTTLNTQFDRVAMHGTRRAILEAQAAAANLPLWVVPLPWPCPNAVYVERMEQAIQRAKDERVDAIAFGDLFLADIRAYRENMLKNTGIEPLFPLWNIPTPDLARQMIAAGLRARLVCVDPRQLPESFSGRDFDESLLAELPPHVDPCGERGEFHTCAYAGPCFAQPIPVESGEIVHREGFVYTDLILQSESASAPAA